MPIIKYKNEFVNFSESSVDAIFQSFSFRNVQGNLYMHIRRSCDGICYPEFVSIPQLILLAIYIYLVHHTDIVQAHLGNSLYILYYTMSHVIQNMQGMIIIIPRVIQPVQGMTLSH